MSVQNCFDRLNSLAEVYNNTNPSSTNAKLRPKPLFFERPGCGGNYWPDILSPNPPTEAEYDTPFPGPTFPMNSFWIPAGWQVILKTTSSNFLFPEKPVPYPILRNTVSDLTVKVSNIETTFKGARPIPPKLQMNVPELRLSAFQTIDETTWKLLRCTSYIPAVFMGHTLYEPYVIGSLECDDFFTAFCAKGSPHRDDPICSCIREEDEIADKYCLPGNTNPACAGKDRLAPQIPVRCIGKECALKGYLLRRMDRPCDITLCQQIIDVAPGVVTDLNNTIWCGDRHVSNDDGKLTDLGTGVDPKFETKETPLEGPLDVDSIPMQIIIVAVLFLILFFLAIPLYIQNQNLQKHVLRRG